MAKNAICRLDKMSGTGDASQLKSVMFYSGSNPAGIQNGSLVSVDLGTKVGREGYKATAVAASETNLYLIATPELMYEETKHNLYHFINEEGDLSRAYKLHTGDTFSVTAEAFVGGTAPTVGHTAYAEEGETTIKTATAGGTDIAFGIVTAKEVVGKDTYYVIDVL